MEGALKSIRRRRVLYAQSNKTRILSVWTHCVAVRNYWNNCSYFHFRCFCTINVSLISDQNRHSTGDQFSDPWVQSVYLGSRSLRWAHHPLNSNTGWSRVRRCCWISSEHLSKFQLNSLHCSEFLFSKMICLEPALKRNGCCCFRCPLLFTSVT